MTCAPLTRSETTLLPANVQDGFSIEDDFGATDDFTRENDDEEEFLRARRQAEEEMERRRSELEAESPAPDAEDSAHPSPTANGEPGQLPCRYCRP